MMARGFNRTGHTGLTVSVVICAYTLDRWDLLQRAVASVLAQNVPAEEVIVVIDHNPELAERCRARWPWGSDFRVRVVENVYSGRLGSARNTALELVAGEIVAFLDDDACAPPDWLGRLVAAYESEEQVMAVGGAPEPEFECPRPSWFPFEFDWVFGCSYRGLPVARAPARRLIGANMSVRRSAILAVGGFHSDDHDDMDLSHRVADAHGHDSVVYDPMITVRHFVSADRLTWSYFWRRCFLVNRGKVLAFSDMADAGGLVAELVFVRSILIRSVPRYALRGGRSGPLRAAAALAGVTLAAVGHLVGRYRLLVGVTASSETRGLEPTPAMQLDRSK
jgi:glucosyl-dolichyl phosphate glucuronosyltransferase